jgi:hypothetical protein
MTKKEIDEIRPECRKLVIKSQIIDLSHQLYRNIWLRLTMAIIGMQLLFAFGGIFLKYACGIETVSTSTAGAVCSWGYCLLVVIGSFISNKAMNKAQTTKSLLYKLIDSYVEDKVIESEEDEGEE